MQIKENEKAIGVFDSGLGGLTVVKELMKTLPQEEIVYFGDTARVPYGTKSKESIIRFSKENTEELLKHNVKMIVVACNSSSSYALEELKQNYSLPIMGVITPGARKAVQATKNNRIGVIATKATIASQEYTKNINWFNSKVIVFSQACPLFVPLVEEGWFDKKVTFHVAQEYLKDLKKAKIDTLILGCTHYPLLKRTIGQVMGTKVKLIDSAAVVAQEVKDLLFKKGINNPGGRKAQHKFIVSDRPQDFKKIAKTFLGQEIEIRIKE
jgi:glutamate racemase